MNNYSITDKELVNQLFSNSEDAFRKLYLRYKDKLWNYCFCFLKCEEEASDLVQEIFLQIWEMRTFLDPELSFSSLLYTMARNRIVNHFRHMDVTLEYEKIMALKASEKVYHTDQDLDLSDYLKVLEAAVDKLPPQRKRIFKLSRFEHLSHKEIALKLEISIYTVQEHISASLAFIKSYFAEHTDLTLTVTILISLFFCWEK